MSDNGIRRPAQAAFAAALLIGLAVMFGGAMMSKPTGMWVALGGLTFMLITMVVAAAWAYHTSRGRGKDDFRNFTRILPPY